MPSAKKLPSGNWRAQYSTGEKNEKGKYIYGSVTMPTEKEAIFAALELELKHKEAARNPTNITVAEAMKKYIENKSNVLSPSTIRLYLQIKKDYLKNLMPIKLNKLSNNLIQSAINDEALNHSPKTVRNIYGLLTAVLRLYNHGLFVRLNVTLPQKQKKEIQILTAEQTAILIKSVKGKTIELPILLAVWLGLRQSEICGLKWDCVDLENNILIIKRAKVMGINNEYVLKDTKTYTSTRKLKVPNFIMDKIKHIPKKKEFLVDIKPKSIYDGLKYELKKNNLPDIRFHDLRHFNASIMLQLNIPDKYAMERGGWSTNHTMKNIYQHTFDKERESVDDRINNYFENLLSHELSHGN